MRGPLLIALGAAALVACAGEDPVAPPVPDAGVRSDAGAGDGGADGGESAEARSVREARLLHPRMIDVFTGVVKRSCSPNPGVCHNDGNYPDLRTPGALLSAVDAPCNLEIPEPTLGWDACEPRGDVIRFEDGTSARIAWVEQAGPGRWRFELSEAPRVTDDARISFYTVDGDVILAPVPEWQVIGHRRLAETTLEVTSSPVDAYVLEVIDATLRTVVGGDTNKNGTWGADQPTRGRLVAPGDLSRSYLWGRLTATVPGTRMPLANQPLSNADYAALACWIEQLGRGGEQTATALIDYDACAYAKAPLDPAF